jgi:hypothetical protein
MLEKNEKINQAVYKNLTYICNETLSQSFELVDTLNANDKIEIELIDDIKINLIINKYFIN